MIRLPGFVTREHVLPVPLDHADPHGPTIEVFARELVAADKAADGSAERLPWLLFLQGGPGGKSPRPAESGHWIGHALQTHRVLLLDQRGCGRSAPIGPRTAEGRTADELAAYLRLFRADAIVEDAEIFRRHLLGDGQWETLGQSYGGFLTLTYLSRHPEALRRCYVAGGIPGLGATAADVYARTFPRIERRNAEYYARYPRDREVVRRLADRLLSDNVRLPDGDRLTARRLQVLGSGFGMSDGFESLHWLLDDLDPDGGISETFAYQAMVQTGFVGGPLFALQEYCYADGAATGWAAQAERDRRPQFAEDADPLLFTGETMFPWMFSDIRCLRPFAEAADVNAVFTDWPALVDPTVLAGNEVPLICAVYADDMYVDAELQLDTLDRIPNSRAWVTNELEHDGLRAGPYVLQRLFDMGMQRI